MTELFVFDYINSTPYKPVLLLGYSMAQLQGNVYTRVTRKILACISRVLAKVLTSRGAARIQVCAKL